MQLGRTNEKTPAMVAGVRGRERGRARLGGIIDGSLETVEAHCCCGGGGVEERNGWSSKCPVDLPRAWRAWFNKV